MEAVATIGRNGFILDPFLMELSSRMTVIGGDSAKAAEMIGMIEDRYVRECKLPAIIKKINLIAGGMAKQLKHETREVFRSLVHDFKGIATTVSCRALMASKCLAEKLYGKMEEDLRAIEEASSFSTKMIIAANEQIMDQIKNGRVEGFEIGEKRISEIVKMALSLSESRNSANIRHYENILPDVMISRHGLDLIRVLMNIFINDYDAMSGKMYRDNTPSLKIYTSVVGGVGASNLVIDIEDNGIGMSQEIVEKIFDDGFTTKREEGGSGIGLHFCKIAIEEKMGGKLTVKSQLGKGTTFKIEIPLA